MSRLHLLGTAVMAAAGCKHTGDTLDYVSQTDCTTSSTEVSLAETTDLGFSADDVLAFVPEPLTLAVHYTNSALKSSRDEMIVTPTSDPAAMRVSRVGTECEFGPQEAGSEPEVVSTTWTADLVSASGGVAADGVTVTMEAGDPSPSHLWFTLGANGGPATISTDLWDAFFEEFPLQDGNDCQAWAGWTGATTAGSWWIGIDCDSTGDGVPEHSGQWAMASFDVKGLAASK